MFNEFYNPDKARVAVIEITDACDFNNVIERHSFFIVPGSDVGRARAWGDARAEYLKSQSTDEELYEPVSIVTVVCLLHPLVSPESNTKTLEESGSYLNLRVVR